MDVLTLNIPTNPNLKFVALSIDKKGNNNEGDNQYGTEEIHSRNKNNGLYVVYFDDKMIGKKPSNWKENSY